jgi:hypothetical protein
VEPFTNTYETADIKQAKWLAAKSAIPKLLKTWSGLICFASNRLCISGLVSALQLPDLQLNVWKFTKIKLIFTKNHDFIQLTHFTQDILLDTFFLIFRLPLPKINEELVPASAAGVSLDKTSQPDPSTHNIFRHNMLHNYLAILLVAFNDAKLLEVN